MTALGHNPVLDAALGYASRGWPVFPCQPGRKLPATSHGYLDATTDPSQITAWFASHPGRNIAIATGTPGPDVLDIDQHGPAGNGYPALNQLARAGLLDAATCLVRTPGDGLHFYFAGSAQRNGHLPASHLDFLARGGYILAPPSRIKGTPYQLIRTSPGTRGLDWASVRQLLAPGHPAAPRRPGRAGGADIVQLAQWVGRQATGNRNAGLFWAANRALEADPAADLGPLADAARTAGLDDRAITATLKSARRTTQHNPAPELAAEAEPR
jgi:hypothetical protein